MIVKTQDKVEIEIQLYGELNEGEHDIIGKTFKAGLVTGVVHHIKSCTEGVFLFTPSGYKMNVLEARQACDWCFSPMRWYHKQVSRPDEPTDYIDEFACTCCGRVGVPAKSNTVGEKVDVLF